MIEFATTDGKVEAVVYGEDLSVLDIVPVEVHGLLAVCHDHTWHGERRGTYQVLHMPSGKMVANAMGRGVARELVGRIESLDWAGTEAEVVERLRGVVPGIVREVCG